MYKFKLAIGDWSRDGHGLCEYLIMGSNKPVQEVRQFMLTKEYIKMLTGYNIEITNLLENE